MNDVYAVFLVAEEGGFKQWRDEGGHPRVFTSQEAAEERARAESEKGHTAFAGKLWPVDSKIPVVK